MPIISVEHYQGAPKGGRFDKTVPGRNGGDEKVCPLEGVFCPVERQGSAPDALCESLSLFKGPVYQDDAGAHGNECQACCSACASGAHDDRFMARRIEAAAPKRFEDAGDVGVVSYKAPSPSYHGVDRIDLSCVPLDIVQVWQDTPS